MKSLLYRGLRALAATACLTVGAYAPAQQPAPAIPSIEELKRQLEAKRLEARRQLEAKQKQPKSHQEPDAAAKTAPSTSAQPSAPSQDTVKAPPAGKNRSPVKLGPPAPSTDLVSSPPDGTDVSHVKPAPPASADLVKAPPAGKNISPVKLAPNSTAPSDSCPYPDAARRRGDTGTVILLLYVAPDGRAVDTQIETSSGSDVLDEAAASCMKEFGRFVPKRVGARAEGGWFRTKFHWSFGD
jgi:protein TonB